MLKEALEWMVGNRCECNWVNERVFFRRKSEAGEYWEEKHPDVFSNRATRNRLGEMLELSSVASLIDFCKAMKEHEFKDPRIVIYGSEIEVMWDIFSDVKRRIYSEATNSVMVSLQFDFTRDHAFSAYSGFLEFLDLHEDAILDSEEREKLRSAFKRLKFIKRDETEWEDHGAYITVKQTSMKGVEPECSVAVPNRLSLFLPTGTLEFEIKHKFALKIKPETQSVDLVLLNAKEVVADFMRECKTLIRAGLGDDILVLDGAVV
jgi:hypothetical protein